MKKINLKDYYAHISIDTYIDIPDEVFNIFEEHRKAEQAYQSKVYYHKAYYSLDRDDGIEHSALFVSLSPDGFTNASSQGNSSMLPLLPCQTNRQNASTLIISWT